MWFLPPFKEAYLRWKAKRELLNYTFTEKVPLVVPPVVGQIHDNPEIKPELQFGETKTPLTNWSARTDLPRRDFIGDISGVTIFPRALDFTEVSHLGFSSSSSMSAFSVSSSSMIQDVPTDEKMKRIEKYRKEHPEESDCLDIMKKKAYPNE